MSSSQEPRLLHRPAVILPACYLLGTSRSGPVRLPTMFRSSHLLPLLPIAIGFAGCVTTVPQTAANLSNEVAAHSGLKVGWPRSAAEAGTFQAQVNALLGEPLTPDGAAAVALLNNRHLRSKLEDVGISEADVIAAARLPNPSLAASVRWPNSAPRLPNVELSASLDLLNGFLLPMWKRLAGEQLAATESQVAFAILEIVSQAKSAAYTVQADAEFLLRVQAMRDTNAAAAEFAQRQFNAGNISRLDLLNQQVAAQEIGLQLERAKANLQRDREKLNRLLGLGATQTNWEMAAGLPSAPEAAPALKAESLEASAVKQRLDLSAASVRVAMARQALQLKRNTRFLPASINFGADTESNAAGADGRSRLTGPTLELALPVFSQGQSEVARLSAGERRAEDDYEALQADVQSEVREALAALRSARRSAEYFDTILVPQRRAILRETLLQYNAMQKSSYELLAAKLQLVSVERDRIAAWRDYWIARAELERAVGGQIPSS